MKKWFLISFILLACGCRPEPTLVEVKIVDVYRERRFGANDNTTVVEFPNGTRRTCIGRLGEKGETIKIPVIIEK